MVEGNDPTSRNDKQSKLYPYGSLEELEEERKDGRKTVDDGVIKVEEYHHEYSNGVL